MLDPQKLDEVADQVDLLSNESFWHTRRVGAYLLFVGLAFCASCTITVSIAMLIGTRPSEWPLMLGSILNYTVFLGVFMTLRDLTRSPFDIVASTARKIAKRERRQ